jgi:hypothetical protein
MSFKLKLISVLFTVLLALASLFSDTPHYAYGNDNIKDDLFQIYKDDPLLYDAAAYAYSYGISGVNP